MARKRMNTVEDFLRETAIHEKQYSDGLIRKGEFICHCMNNLKILMEKDLNEARNMLEGYGWSGNDFSTWMHEQAGKE